VVGPIFIGYELLGGGINAILGVLCGLMAVTVALIVLSYWLAARGAPAQGALAAPLLLEEKEEL
jgi:hypothetical protein